MYSAHAFQAHAHSGLRALDSAYGNCARVVHVQAADHVLEEGVQQPEEGVAAIEVTAFLALLLAVVYIPPLAVYNLDC